MTATPATDQLGKRTQVNDDGTVSVKNAEARTPRGDVIVLALLKIGEQMERSNDREKLRDRRNARL